LIRTGKIGTDFRVERIFVKDGRGSIGKKSCPPGALIPLLAEEDNQFLVYWG